ncbi:hypothetical protein IAU60_002301 [Kwoniella sp. DSM 27419]
MSHTSAAIKRGRHLSTVQLLCLSLLLQLGLLVYANHVDSHPERYGGLRYTDVDWRVVSDGARLIFRPDAKYGNIAQGWLPALLGLTIGDPYERATFRYTPLLALFVSPSIVHPLLGRLLLVVTSLCVPPLLFTLPARSRPTFWSTHLLWTLNPFVMNITTRGSPESIICLLTVLILVSMARGNERSAAIWLGLAVSWKIYPAIHVPALWSALARRHGWLGRGVWLFATISATTFVMINGVFWGQPFLEHTYLYHLTRLDHRHNFSPYFYPIYLSFFSFDAPLSTLETIVRHPLSSFLPQITLVSLAGFALEPTTGLTSAMFVQTVVFVVFNKVCTSQYFMWFLPLLPPLLRHLRLKRAKGITIVAAWILGQALWLGTAYQLELMARGVYLWLWAAGLALFGISVWIIGELIDGSLPVRREAKID